MIAQEIAYQNLTIEKKPRPKKELQTVFLDRDGVINENRSDHVKSWSEFQFLPGALSAIARLSELRLNVFIISNQAIVNRGLVTEETIDVINARMVNEIEKHGGRIDEVAYCPHRQDEDCNCRKPQPGLLLSLATKHNLDLQNALMVGDAIADMEAGKAAGCSGILVLTGRGQQQFDLAQKTGQVDFEVVPDLQAAVDLLINDLTK